MSIAETAPNPHDVALGATVRLHRKELGLSQDQLARAIGITFQQVQKYEHGTNRISFSRLVEIGAALETTATDLVAEVTRNAPGKKNSKHIGLLTEPGATDLLEAFGKIVSTKQRRSVLNLARTLAGGA